MNVFVTIASLLLGLKIITSNGEKRFMIFILSLLFVTSAVVIMHRPTISSHSLFVISFFISLLYNRQLNRISTLPILLLLALYFISLVLINIKSSYIPLITGLYKSVMLFIETILPLIIGYSSGISVNNINKRLYTPLMCILLYGFFTYIFKTDPYQHLFFDNYLESFHDYYLFDTRARISSTWSHPIAYGLICSCFFILLWNKRKENYVKLILSFLLLTVFFCGSRTAIFSLIVMFTIFALMYYDFSSNIRIFFTLGFFAVIIVLCIPAIADKIKSVLDIFFVSDPDAVQGSSLAMRESQFEAVLSLFSEFPKFGGGIGYITDYMKFGTEMSFSSDFLGFESYLFFLLIERGLFGTCVVLFFIIYIVLYFLKNKKYSPLSSSIGISLFVGFYVFAFATSPLDTWTIPMFFVGVCMNDIESNKKLIINDVKG